MKVLAVLFLLVSLRAEGQIINEFDFNKIHLRFEISNIICDDVDKKYSFDYAVHVGNNDSTPQYIAVENQINDTTILSSFSGTYYLDRVMKFYLGTCDESRLPLSCRLHDESLILKRLNYGQMLSSKNTVVTTKDVIMAFKNAEIDIVFAYFNSVNPFGEKIDAPFVRKGYWDSQNDVKKLSLKINIQN
jgi:hypothetical protein